MASLKNLLTTWNLLFEAFSLCHPNKAQSSSIARWLFRLRFPSHICLCEKLMWSESFTTVGSPLEHFRHLWPPRLHQVLLYC
ncbi:hypothetical protein ACFXTN_026000 [Malus domestica]